MPSEQWKRRWVLPFARLQRAREHLTVWEAVCGVGGRCDDDRLSGQHFPGFAALSPRSAPRRTAAGERLTALDLWPQEGSLEGRRRALHRRRWTVVLSTEEDDRADGRIPTPLERRCGRSRHEFDRPPTVAPSPVDQPAPLLCAHCLGEQPPCRAVGLGREVERLEGLAFLHPLDGKQRRRPARTRRAGRAAGPWPVRM